VSNADKFPKNELIVKRLADYPIITITLNRPRYLNALTNKLLLEIINLFERMKENREIKGIVIFGNGEKAFCSGSDINEFKNVDAYNMRYHCSLQHQLRLLIQKMPQIIITGLHGYVLGGGLELVLAADLRIAEENTVFGYPEIDLGGMPGGGGLWDLLRIVGVSKAKEILLTGNRFNEEDALRLGIISKIVSKGQIVPETLKFAESIVKKSSISLSLIKLLVNQWANNIHLESLLDKLAVTMCSNEGDLFKEVQRFKK